MPKNVELVFQSKKYHRLFKALLNHFIDFVNRPYFHQDVAFETRKLKLDDSEVITMPYIIRTVTRSTMVRPTVL
jgi:hypothetical protein